MKKKCIKKKCLKSDKIIIHNLLHLKADIADCIVSWSEGERGLAQKGAKSLS